jgi:hypothetical protein
MVRRTRPARILIALKVCHTQAPSPENSRLISKFRFSDVSASVDTEISAQVTCASVRVSDKKSARRRLSFLLSLFD